MTDRNILIVYFSYSGNTKSVAKKIQKLTGGDIFEIKTLEEYPENYNEVLNISKKEKKENSMPLLTDHGNIAHYDTIYLGTPVWWYSYAAPIRTFLSAHDFSGKTVIPFCTHGGGGASYTYTDIKKLLPNSTIKEGFTSFESSAKESDIENWIKSH